MSYGKQQELAWLKWELESMKMPKIKHSMFFFFEAALCFAQWVCFSQLWGTKKICCCFSAFRTGQSLTGQDLVKTPVKGRFLHLWFPSLRNHLKLGFYMFWRIRVLDRALLCWMLLLRLLRCFCVVTRVFQMVARVFWVVLLSFYSLCFFIPPNKNNVPNCFKSMCNNIYIIVHIV